MENWPEQLVRQSGHDVTIDATMVTKTHNLDMLGIYKAIRHELLAVVQHSSVVYLDCSH